MTLSLGSQKHHYQYTLTSLSPPQQQRSHTTLPASCSTVILFTGQPIVCVEAWWTMSPISVQAMIQHCYCDWSFSHLTRQDGFPVG